jgi:hypothetical protein
MAENELEKAHTKIRELAGDIRSDLQLMAKQRRILQLHEGLARGNIPDWVPPELLLTMLKTEGDQAAQREAAVVESLSPQELIEHGRRQRTAARCQPRGEHR